MATTLETLALGLDARRMKTGAREAKAALRQVGKTARRVTNLIAGLVGGFTAFAATRSALRTIIGFDDAIKELGAVAQATDAQLEALTATARELGATTRFTAREAAEGLTFLARAGFSTSEAMQAVGGTLDLASAGLLSLGEAADIASNVVAQFNLTASETGRVGDVLVTTANSANTSVKQLAEAMKFVGPVAGALNKTVEETAALIGALGNSGIQASQAGTNLRGVYAALLGPTDAAQNAIAGLNLSLEQVDINTRSAADVFRTLQTAGLSAGDAIDIFGRRNAAAALVLARSTDNIEELTKANLESEDAARRTAERMESGLGGALRSLRSAVEEVFLAIGEDGLKGGLETLVRTTTSAIRILSGTATAADTAQSGAEELARAIRALVTAFKTLIALKVAAEVQKIVVAVNTLRTATIALQRSTIIGWILQLGVAVAGTVVAFQSYHEEIQTVTASSREYTRTLRGLSSALDTVREAQSDFNFALSQGDNVAAVRALRLELGSIQEIGKNAQRLFFETERGFTSLEELETLVGTKLFTELLKAGRNRELQLSEAVRTALTLGDQTLAFPSQLIGQIIKEALVAPRVAVIDEYQKEINANLKSAEDEIAKAAQERSRRREIAFAAAAQTGIGPVPPLTPEQLLFGGFTGEEAIAALGLTIDRTLEQALQLVGSQVDRAAQERLEKTRERNALFAQALSDPFTDAFTDIISGTKSVSGAFADMAQDIASSLGRLVISRAIINPLLNSVFGLQGLNALPQFARGGIVGATSAGGGIVSAPTAIAGEAGPEAVLPLKKTRRGTLGVEAATTGSTTVNMTVVTQDAGSFRRSQRQIQRDLRKGLG